MSSSDVIAARGDDRAPPERDQAPVELEVRAAEQAVAVDRGHLEGLDADVGEALIATAASTGSAPGRPAVTDGLAVAHVDRDGDPSGAVGVDEAAGEGRILERGGADRRPGPLLRRGRPRRHARPGGHRPPRPGSAPRPHRRSPRSPDRVPARRSARHRGRPRGSTALRPAANPTATSRDRRRRPSRGRSRPAAAERRDRPEGRSPAGSRTGLPSPWQHDSVVAR